MDLRALLIALALASSAAACGAAAPRSTRPEGPLTARDFYPLGAGFIWTYDVDAGTGLNQLGIMRVVEATGGHFVLRNDGSTVTRTLEIREGGIYNVGDGHWHLQDPIALGSEWDGPTGRVRVTAVEQDVDVPAGHFERCATIEWTNETAHRTSRETYCPGTGPVVVETTQSLELTEGGLTIRGTLRMPLDRGDVEEPEGYDAPPR